MWQSLVFPVSLVLTVFEKQTPRRLCFMKIEKLEGLGVSTPQDRVEEVIRSLKRGECVRIIPLAEEWGMSVSVINKWAQRSGGYLLRCFPGSPRPSGFLVNPKYHAKD